MIMKNYIKQHIESGMYGEGVAEGGFVYRNVKGWNDYLINNSLVFSHRKTEYTVESFDEGLCSRDYYEVVCYVAGDVEYVREDEVAKPQSGMVVCYEPDVMHTARLLSDGEYERYVLKFERSFFDFGGEEIAIPAFITDKETRGVIQPDEATSLRLREMLAAAKSAAERETPMGRALAYSYIIQFFDTLCGTKSIGKNENLPENIARIKKYIDTYYSSIEGVSEIASYFFYSREHASRLFRQYFNITLSDYLMQRRVAESVRLLLEGSSVSDACYAVGFHSVSSYINAFKRVTGCLPSEYKKKRN